MAEDVRMVCVSFLTDYGLADGFVAACHGVIVRELPDARIIDITHLVPPGDIRRGAEILAQTVAYLPVGVHLAVVDPGVGTSRRPVAVQTEHGWLVGPDNGLLVAAADTLGGALAAYALAVSPGTPATFHGRDVFAPAAARLARGEAPGGLGAPVDPEGLVRPRPPIARLAPPGEVETEVALVDHYGNVQFAARPELLAQAGLRPGGTALVTRAGGSPLAGPPFGVTFGSVAAGELVLYVDSAGRVALAVNRGNAAARLGLAAGDVVRIGPADAGSGGLGQP